jgi:hypothetical protein
LYLLLQPFLEYPGYQLYLAIQLAQSHLSRPEFPECPVIQLFLGYLVLRQSPEGLWAQLSLEYLEIQPSLGCQLFPEVPLGLSHLGCPANLQFLANP